ncbi:MAG: hypothetical protein ACOYVK_06690 [Bacillota bacterium]
MKYCMFTSLDIVSCEQKLNDALINDFLYSLSGGMGYVGRLDSYKKHFWVINRIDIYSTNRGYKFFSTRKFHGELHEDGNETRIVGEFKVLNGLKIFWSIWYIILTFIFALCVINVLYDATIYESFDLCGIGAIIAVVLLGLVGWLIIKFNIHKSKKVEDDTIQFLKELLEVNKVECNEYF